MKKNGFTLVELVIVVVIIAIIGIIFLAVSEGTDMISKEYNDWKGHIMSTSNDGTPTTTVPVNKFVQEYTLNGYTVIVHTDSSFVTDPYGTKHSYVNGGTIKIGYY